MTPATHAPTAAAAAAPAAGLRQYLTFLLAKEEYAVDILKVQEIKGRTAITPIPNTPPHVRGMMNLRGTVVPVVDLRLKFNMEAGSYDKFSVIVVVMIGKRIMGLLVDAVSDVLDIASSDIEPPPELGASVDTSFLTGMAKKGERLVLLLDIERTLGEVELGGVPR